MKYLLIKTSFKLTLIRVSLCLEGLPSSSRNTFFFLFFCGIINLICELRHKFFINLRLRQINNLLPSALFLRNLRSGKFTHSVICGNTYALTPHAPTPTPLLIGNCIFSEAIQIISELLKESLMIPIIS